MNRTARKPNDSDFLIIEKFYVERRSENGEWNHVGTYNSREAAEEVIELATEEYTNP